MKNTFGSDLSLTIFGESHGRAIGAVLDGMAAGVPVDEAFVAACMATPITPPMPSTTGFRMRGAAGTFPAGSPLPSWPAVPSCWVR